MKLRIILTIIVCTGIFNTCLASRLRTKHKVDETLYTINGQNVTMMEHVYDALSNSNTNPFSVTRLIRYEQGSFIDQGDINSCLLKDFDDIIKGNFVYAPHFAQRKTKLNPNNCVGIDALILGTKRKSLAQKLETEEFKNFTTYILTAKSICEKRFKKHRALAKLNNKFPQYDEINKSHSLRMQLPQASAN